MLLKNNTGDLSATEKVFMIVPKGYKKKQVITAKDINSQRNRSKCAEGSPLSIDSFWHEHKQLQLLAGKVEQL